MFAIRASPGVFVKITAVAIAMLLPPPIHCWERCSSAGWPFGHETCGKGQWCEQGGVHNDCANCPGGKYQDDQGAANYPVWSETTCKSCSSIRCASGRKRAGSWCGDGTPYVCKKCSPGTVMAQDNHDRTACTPCELGQYQGADGR